MLSFWPGIGKINVQRHDRLPGKKIFQEIGGFDANRPQILQTSPLSFFVDLSQPAQEAFHPEKIMFRMQLGVFGNKRPIARAQFYFHGLFLYEQFADVDSFDNGMNLVDQGFVGGDVAGHRSIYVRRLPLSGYSPPCSEGMNPRPEECCNPSRARKKIYEK